MISGIQNTSASIAQLANQSQGVNQSQGANQSRGANQSQGSNQSQSSPNESVSQGGGEDYQQKARSKGIPEAVIQQGKQAARQWLADNKQVADTAENSTESVSSPQKAANNRSETLLDTFV